MIYVGIDIAQQNHFASIMNSDREILKESFSFTNDHVGFQKLLKALEKYPKTQPNPGRIAKIHLTRLTNFLSKSSHGHFK